MPFALYFRYKSPENYYHFLIYMISNLRHIDKYNDVTHIYFQYCLPYLLNKSSYLIELLSILCPMIRHIENVNIIPEGALNVVYKPCPDTLNCGDHYSPESYYFLRNAFLPSIKEYKSESYKRIYISRSNATKRRIINESECINYLISKGFHILHLETCGGIEQMAHFYNADIIISPHGAALVNTIFCKEKTKVIEICSNSMTYLKYFSHISEVMNLDYYRFQDVIDDPININSDMQVCIFNLNNLISTIE